MLKTRIIQNEPEPSATRTAEAPVADERETWLRRGLFSVAVVGYFVLGIVHPLEIEVGDATTLYLWLHILQPFLILCLAWGTWFLVKDLPGRAAQLARIAIVPYAIFYSIFEAIAGVALGQIIRQAGAAPASDGAAVQRIIDNSGTDYIGMGFWIAAGLTWFVMAFAAALAVKQIGGLGPTLLMTFGAGIFAIVHPLPFGPPGIALFGLGLLWLERRREAAKAPGALPVPAP